MPGWSSVAKAERRSTKQKRCRMELCTKFIFNTEKLFPLSIYECTRNRTSENPQVN